MTLVHPFNYLVLGHSFLPSLCLSFFVPSCFLPSRFLLCFLHSVGPTVFLTFFTILLFFDPSSSSPPSAYSFLSCFFLRCFFPSFLQSFPLFFTHTLSSFFLSSFAPSLLSCFLLSATFSFLSSFRLFSHCSRHHSFVFFLSSYILPSIFPTSFLSSLS